MSCRRLKFVIGISLLLGALNNMFTNCAKPLRFEQSSVEELSSTNPEPPGHPPVIPLTSSSAQLQVVHKDYMVTIFREVFGTGLLPVVGLEDILLQWGQSKGATFGLACDLYSSYSGKDCDGSSLNTNSSFYVDPSALRESHRIQLCENVLGLDDAVLAALAKAEIAVQEPNLELIKQSIPLFFRGDLPDAGFAETLNEFDLSMKNAGESNLNRWRGILLQICESPAWQIL